MTTVPVANALRKTTMDMHSLYLSAIESLGHVERPLESPDLLQVTLCL